MKDHKYTSFAAFLFMIAALVAECLTDSKLIHILLLLGGLISMVLSIYSGHKIVLDRKKES